MRALSLFFFIVLTLSVSGQNSKTLFTKATSPAVAGFSEERIKRIDQTLQSWIDQKQMNGCVAFISKNGKIVYNKAFGYDNMEKGTPMRTDHIFRIMSQSKAITSVAIMMLFEEGKVLLNDPISKFIPEFKNPQVIKSFNLKDTSWVAEPAKREITIKDLLTHTSGLGYAQIGSAEAKAMYHKYQVPGGIAFHGMVLGDAMKRLGKLPLFHQPGEKYTYGLNNDVLGYVVEVASGMSFDKFLRTRLFEPLGMKDTYFYIPKDKQNRLVSAYHQYAEGLTMMPEKMTIVEDVYRDYPNLDGTYFSGGAGLSSTIYDYALFLQMLLNGGSYNGKQFLSRATVRMMISNQLEESVIGADDFGLGFGLTNEKEASSTPLSVGSFEWGGMFATTYWADPKEGIVALIFRNIWPSTFDAATRFKILTYQALAD
ncbi:MAG: serine hydrolase domain-containing protein [Sphingobacteriales bacterium]|jgi:CubicO group peptidase (beta-lactamase class C family)